MDNWCSYEILDSRLDKGLSRLDRNQSNLNKNYPHHYDHRNDHDPHHDHYYHQHHHHYNHRDHNHHHDLPRLDKQLSRLDRIQSTLGLLVLLEGVNRLEGCQTIVPTYKWSFTGPNDSLIQKLMTHKLL